MSTSEPRQAPWNAVSWSSIKPTSKSRTCIPVWMITCSIKNAGRTRRIPQPWIRQWRADAARHTSGVVSIVSNAGGVSKLEPQRSTESLRLSAPQAFPPHRTRVQRPFEGGTELPMSTVPEFAPPLVIANVRRSNSLYFMYLLLSGGGGVACR